jgi:hypothetical protein
MSDDLRDYLESNRSAAALWREYEQKLVTERTPLVDLRLIPRDRWPEFFGRDVTLPPEVQRYLDGRELVPMTKEEIDGLEDAVARYHGVEAPYYVDMSITHWERFGHAWRYVPEAAPYMSGFEFNSADA